MINTNKLKTPFQEKSWIDLEKHLLSLSSKEDFIVFEHPDTQEFMQAHYVGSLDNKKYHIEYADIATKTLYEAKDLISQDKALEIFRDFFDKKPFYKSALKWSLLQDFDPKVEEEKGNKPFYLRWLGNWPNLLLLAIVWIFKEDIDEFMEGIETETALSVAIPLFIVVFFWMAYKVDFFPFNKKD